MLTLACLNKKNLWLVLSIEFRDCFTSSITARLATNQRLLLLFVLTDSDLCHNLLGAATTKQQIELTKLAPLVLGRTDVHGSQIKILPLLPLFGFSFILRQKTKQFSEIFTRFSLLTTCMDGNQKLNWTLGLMGQCLTMKA